MHSTDASATWRHMNPYVPRLARAFLTFVLPTFFLSAMNAQRLDDLRWKKRVIIIYAPNGSEQKLSQQERLLHSHDAELKERDLTKIILRSRAENAEIAERFNLAKADFALLLIGKDGLEKLRSRDVVSPETLFRLVDSMPMRQEEMREKGKPSQESK